MKKGAAVPESVDAYLAGCPPEIRKRLQAIRKIVRAAAPKAEEKISYRMPAFFLDGALVYYAAFKHHIGFFPPVRGDAAIEKALARYAGPKGNLQFPHDEPLPIALITRIAKFRVKQNLAKAVAKKSKSRS